MEYFSKILHVDYDESAHSLIERFMSLDDQDIIFTIPMGASIFKDASELRLLKHAIDKSGKNVVLVSQDNEGIELAHDIGFRVEQEFLELIAPDDGATSKYSADTHRHPRVSDILYPQKNKEVPASPKRVFGEEPKEIIEELEPESTESFKIAEEKNEFFSPKYFSGDKEKSQKKKTLAPIIVFISMFVVIAMAAFGFAVMVVLPKATLSITPQKEIVILDLSVKADTSLSDINFSTNTIPGQIVSVEKEKEFQFDATGVATGESRATGVITVYNEHTPSQNQTLVKTTRFQTADGKVFRTTTSINVPAAKTEGGKITPGTVEVSVIADAVGPEYNIGPTDFTIPGLVGSAKEKSIYGKSTQSMQGGSKGQGLMVSLDDINNAKSKAENELLEASRNELREKLPKDLEIANDAIETKIIEENISATAGQLAEKFSISLKVSAAAFLFQEKDIEALIEKNIEAKLMRDRITYKDMRRNYNNVDADFSAGKLALIAHIEQDIAAYVDIEALKQSVAGKTEQEVRDVILGNDAIEAANISIRPKFILRKIPNDADKIAVIIED